MASEFLLFAHLSFWPSLAGSHVFPLREELRSIHFKSIKQKAENAHESIKRHF